MNSDYQNDIAEQLTLDKILDAYEVVHASGEVIVTPLLFDAQKMFPEVDQDMKLYLKLENLQKTGSFKIRGVVKQLASVERRLINGEKTIVLGTTGNYGKAVAHCMHSRGLSAKILLAKESPEERMKELERYGMDVQRVCLKDMSTVLGRYLNTGYVPLKTDMEQILGNCSMAVEILKAVPDPDVIVVCCGSGALCASIAATVRQSGLSNCKMYAVEPEGAPRLYTSLREDKRVFIPTATSVATGLTASIAEIGFQLARVYLDDVVLVPDADLIDTLKRMYHVGLVAEPSGCAAMAAVLHRHIKTDLKGKKVVVVITGGNISSEQMHGLIGEY